MSKRFKKLVAIVSAIAMVVAGLTIQPNTANADTSLVNAEQWGSWIGEGATGTVTSTDLSQATIESTIGNTWWNVQTWVNVTMVKGYEYTASFKVTANAPKQFRVDKCVGDGIIFDGEVTVSDWTDNGDGTYSCTYTGTTSEIASTSTFDLRVTFGYFDASNGVVGTGSELENWTKGASINATISDFSLTREAVGETEADPTTAAVEEGYTAVKGDNWTTVGSWKLFAGAGSTAKIAYKGEGSDFSDMTISILEGAGGAPWAIQAGVNVDGLVNGKQYDYTMVINSDKAGTLFTQVPGVTQSGDLTITEGDNTISGTFTAGTANPANGTIMIFPSGMPSGTYLDMVSLEVTEHVEETTTVDPEAPTVDPSLDPYAGLTWKQVGSTDYYVAAGNDEFPINSANDHGNRLEVVPDVNAGTKPIWPAFSDETLNGTSGTFAVGAGIFINYEDLKMNAYNVYEATSAVQTHRFQVIIKAGTPVIGGEEESSDVVETSDVEITTVAEETTTEGPKAPEAPAGFTRSDPTNLPYYFAWAAPANGITNNLYVKAPGAEEFTQVKTGLTGGAIDLASDAETLFADAGTYEIGITAVNATGESTMVTLSFETEGYKAPAPTGLVVVSVDNGHNISVAFAPYAKASSFKLYANGEFVADISNDGKNGAVIPVAETSLEVGKAYDFTLTAIVNGEETDPSGASNLTIPVPSYNVILDGAVVATVEENKPYTFENDYVIDGVPYKAGTITVTGDVVASTLNVALTMVNGASIKKTTPSGMRFKTTVESNVNKDYVQYGTLIAAADEVALPEVGSGAIDIVTNVWADDTSYIGAIVNISESNFARAIIARGYAKINYANADAEIVYSGTVTRTVDEVLAAAGLTADDIK